MKKRILFITNNIKGLFLFRKELIHHLERDYEILVFSPEKNNTFFLGENISHFYINLKPKSINPLAEIISIISLYRKTNEAKADLVLTFTIKPNIYVGLISKLLKIDFIPNITGLGTTFNRGKFIRLIFIHFLRLSMKKTKYIFFQNQHNLDLFNRFKISNAKKILLPGSGVNLQQFQYLPYPSDETLTFMFAGRLIKDKGIHLFLSLAKEFKNKASTKFIVLGNVDSKDSKILELLNCSQAIYYGEVNDLKPFYKESHCVVLPSYHEGISNVLLEAGASGRPVITSNIPGCRETFIEGVSGFGFKKGSYFDLKNQIKKFINLSSESRQKMGINARKHVESNFNREIIIQQYSLIIKEMLNSYI